MEECCLYILAFRVSWEYELWLNFHYSPKPVVASIAAQAVPNEWAELTPHLQPVPLNSQKPFVGVRVFHFSAPQEKRDAFLRSSADFISKSANYSCVAVYEKQAGKYIRVL